jgi:hypothetical protein
MDDINTIPYYVGINADRYEVWRNSGDIGYVQLAFKVITLAIYDLVAGEKDAHESASYFFFGNKEESYYTVWAEVLGIEEGELPEIVVRFRNGQVRQKDVDDIYNLCTTMKTI